jgi:anti-sigma regulatory factor (Ser/Thr protein kinase)
MATTLEVRADATPECIRPLREAVASLASETGMSSVQVEAVKLCVGEAITNAVRHAYPESEPGPVDVSAQVVGDELVVTVADRGRWPENLWPHPEDEGGFGLAFISRLTDGCTFTATSDGTTVEMLFPLRRSKVWANYGQHPAQMASHDLRASRLE